MDYLRSQLVCPDYKKIPKAVIRSKMHAEHSILDGIQRRQLKWYGQLFRMEGSRRLKKIYQWTPHGMRRRERLQQSWKKQVTNFMRSKNMAKDRHSLAFRNGLTALSCIDNNSDNNNNNNNNNNDNSRERTPI